MQTLAEMRTTAGALPIGTWVATALAAGASLLHWITTSTDTHSWSGEAVVSLIAGAGLMALAMVLAAGSLSVRIVRAVFLIGAVATAAVVVAFLLPLLSGVTSGHVDDAGHAGHAVGAGDEVAILDAVLIAVQVALIGVLLWMYRVTGRVRSDDAENAG
jgi:hypothetical protein